MKYIDHEIHSSPKQEPIMVLTKVSLTVCPDCSSNALFVIVRSERDLSTDTLVAKFIFFYFYFNAFATTITMRDT